ncbi:hypothetical protein ABBQ38_011615 [Trebouxia sp. C0009 RCD-2024]
MLSDYGSGMLVHRCPAASLIVLGALRQLQTGMSSVLSPGPSFSGPGSDALTKQSCQSLGKCTKDTPRLSDLDLQKHLQALPAWQLNESQTSLARSFTAKNFVAAVKFFDQVAEIAEQEGHHPDLHLIKYREVQVVLATHAIGGLSMFDVILAAKIDALPVEYSPKWLRQQT